MANWLIFIYLLRLIIILEVIYYLTVFFNALTFSLTRKFYWEMKVCYLNFFIHGRFGFGGDFLGGFGRL
ncbi:hypothetical protein BFX06_12215 [Sulfobacillus thermosulfidooxidans]|nr:hypothetical protein BFX05_10505 [Sulfobacillus thermosulfidooxidans]OLZ17856.1 hypothetical protein BFX06_12215 [Sulfobacillus thermosulfidooxidans]OLZ20403.1 hypothetical protein BFX07_00440 [Sulfobacillus thermosulfidooxidans]